MKILLDHDEEIAAWAAMKLRKPMGSISRSFLRPYIAIGVADYDGIQGALIFNKFDHFDIEMTIVGEHCWTRQVIRWAYDYVFNELNCVRTTICVRASKPKHEALARRLGYVREGVVRRKFGTDDGILMGMLREECRWIAKGN